MTRAVFVHGVPDTRRLWEPMLGHLDLVDPVCVSLPGFDAPVPDGFGATKEEYVDFVIGEVESIGEPVDLVGHDWGALIVQRVASLRPDLLRTWAAGDGPVDSTYVWHEMAQMWQTPEVGEQIMAGFTPEVVPAALEPEGIPSEIGVEMAKYIDDTMKACILKLYRSAVTVGAEWEPGLEQAAMRPALIIWGKEDPYVGPEFGERLAQRVGAELVMLPTRHWWPVQAPAEAAAALADFWARQ